MSFIQLYFCLYIIFIWLIFFVDTFYLNYRKNASNPKLPNKSSKKVFDKLLDKVKEILKIFLYIFIFATIFTIAIKLIIIFKFEPYREKIIDPTYLTIQIIGAIFCFVAISLYTYLVFFEKSFPSCLTLKSGKRLEGIYNYIRHPSYSVYFFITFGTALCLSDPALFVLACINHASIYLWYAAEEKQLRKENQYYDKYLKRTNRFFPRLTKLHN